MTDKYRRGRDIQAAPTYTPKLRQKGPAPLRGLLVILSVLVLVISGFGYFAIGRIGNDIASAGNLALGGQGNKFGEAPDGATDILLVGSDSRTDAQGNPLTEDEINLLRAGDEENDNTDTIMVIRIPNDGSSATAVSIPRDTYIRDKENGNMKINGVYGTYKAEKKSELMAKGEKDDAKLEEEAKDAGRKALVENVSSLTGITVDHYAEIGLLGFVLLTDAVGGVDVCLNEAVNDEFSGANFPAGRQTLNGADALSFVRQRHGLPRGDLDRIVRQQVFMASIVSKVLSSGTLSNPSKLSSLGEAVTRSVKLDKDLDVMTFALQLQNLAGGNVHFSTIPVTSVDGVGDNGESVVTVDTKEVAKFFRTLLGENSEETPTSTSAAPDNEKQALIDATKNTNIHVLNATTTSGLAASVAGALNEMGLKTGEITNAQPGLYNQTTIVAPRADDPAARALAKELGDLPIQASTSLNNGEIAVVVGPDYNGPRSNNPVTEAPTQVGQPGESSDAAESPNFDAGGNGPKCVN